MFRKSMDGAKRVSVAVFLFLLGFAAAHAQTSALSGRVSSQ